MASLIRWNPVRELAAMQNAMDRLMDESWRGYGNALENMGDLRLTLDVHEAQDHYTVITSLPGIPADKLNISVQDDTLTISGEIPAIAPAEGTRALVTERVSGRFSRVVRLPQPVQADAVEATLDNGVLTLTLPKRPELQPRTVSVKINAPSHN